MTEILKNKDEQFILEALRIIEPMIKDIVLSQNEVLVDVGLNKLIISFASKKNNVQIFATTHDLDSIKGLRDAALHVAGDKVAFFKLQHTADAELKSYCYTTDSIDYMLNQEIEVR